MNFDLVKLGKAASALLLAAAMAGCGGGSNTAAVEAEQRALEAARTAASGAAAVAGAAADRAEAAAEAASTAASIAEGLLPGSSAAMNARAAATEAADAATAARTAATAAATAAGRAMDAETSGDAQSQQGLAEAAQEAAEGHSEMAGGHKDDVDRWLAVARTVHEEDDKDNEAEQVELAALAGARQDASAAAAAAAAAAEAAAEHAAKATELADGSQAETDAMNAAKAAMDAAEAAAAASMRATNATMSSDALDAAGDAQTERMTAETEEGNASAALGRAEGVKEGRDLATAQDAAQDAADAADAAADAAKADAAAIAAIAGHDPVKAAEARDAAGEAATAAALAKEINRRAQNATTSAVAMAEQELVEAQRMVAEGKQGEVEDLLEAEETAKTGRDAQEEADRIEMAALMEARGAATMAATAARAAAGAADAAADEAERLLGTDSAEASLARSYANNAATAATDAETARDAANMEGMTSETAMGYQKTAEDAQRMAEAAQREAERLEMAAMAVWQGREGDAITSAQDAAKMHKDAAVKSYEDAMAKASMASSEVMAVQDSDTGAEARAMRARTNSAKAKMYATQAGAALMDADDTDIDDDVAAAETAKDDAETAYNDAMSATTSEAAQAAAGAAGTAAMDAADAYGEVMSKYDAATEAITAANDAANEHVLRLFQSANAYGVSLVSGDLNSAVDAHKNAAASAINRAVTGTGMRTRNNHSITLMQTRWGGTPRANQNMVDVVDQLPVRVDWPYENPTTLLEVGDGMLRFELDLGDRTSGIGVASDLANERRSMYRFDVPVNAVKQDQGLGEQPDGGYQFDAYEIFTYDNRVTASGTVSVEGLVFTDKNQDSPPTAGYLSPGRAITDRESPQFTVYHTPLTRQPNLPDEPKGFTADNNVYHGVGFDHDNDPTTPDLEGKLRCLDNHGETSVDCEITPAGVIRGYRFIGGTNISVEDDSHLVFGIWLAQTPDNVMGGDSDSARDIAFGTFATGGTPARGGTKDAIGKATYEGSAAGLRMKGDKHSAGERADYFYGDATLMADLGTRTTEGNISGRIENIVVAGEKLKNDHDDPHGRRNIIFLDSANILYPSGRFSGTARMGDPDVTNPMTNYPYIYTGTWNGQFFNPVPNDPTTDIDENLMPPESVAGTFGVMRPDDTLTPMDETESYVGAFGAHKM